jgi:hypothetical protein
VPADLTGAFVVVPRLDTGPIESKILTREIRIENGRWIEQAK